MTLSLKDIKKLKFWVKIIVEKDDPGYHAFAPSLKGLHIGGNTPEEALSNAKEAVALYIKSMLKHGDPIPIDLIETSKISVENSSNEIVISTIADILIE